MSSATTANLLSIVEVEKDDRVFCQQPGCGHTVWKAIHIVDDGGKILALGSQCFAIRYGGAKGLGTPSFGTGDGRRLTPEERQLLAENTRELIARFQAEHDQEQAAAKAKLTLTRQAAHIEPARLTTNSPPRHSDVPFEPARTGHWSWQMPQSSMAYFRLNDGSGWVRVQRRDRKQMLAPFPKFDGWDEALPLSIGKVDVDCEAYLLENVERAVAYLRAHGRFDRVSGVRKEIVNASTQK